MHLAKWAYHRSADDDLVRKEVNLEMVREWIAQSAVAERTHQYDEVDSPDALLSQRDLT